MFSGPALCYFRSDIFFLGSAMQSIVWFGLVLATGVCVTGLARIFRRARGEMKSRRRTQQVRKWVREESLVQNPRLRT